MNDLAPRQAYGLPLGLPYSRRPGGRLALTIEAVRSAGAAIGTFWNGVTNPMSVISIGVFALSLAFLGVGHYLFYRTVDKFGVHDFGVLLNFFLSSLGCMVLYAWLYGVFFNDRRSADEHFDGGSVSARAVIQGIAILTAGSFAVCGYEILSWDWIPDADYGLACLVGMPISTGIFALAYGCYANQSLDMCTTGMRWGSGSGTLRVMILMTLMSFVYGSVVICRHSSDFYAIWSSLWLIALVSLYSFAIWILYKSAVADAKDRGFAP